MIPQIEFRTLPIAADEPDDRTAAGVVVGSGDVLELGRVDTTDEPQDTPVRVIWLRVKDIQGCSEVRNLCVRLADDGGMSAADWYIDITDTWTKGKTPLQVRAGTPGPVPTQAPACNLHRIGGGSITGITHDQTSQYIYITGAVGVGQPVGDFGGLRLAVTFDYR